jgi:ATP-dependent DNA helicase RecG
MTDQLDLKELSVRESEQIEWKENVADTDDLAATLCAFANDWANLGGGYVICGAKEERDEHGFARVSMVGLSANRLKEVENKVLALCRDRVSPSIGPSVREIKTDQPDRRVLVFVMPATRSAHMFRKRDNVDRHYVRIGRSTTEARNGIMRELLVRKGALEEWDRRPCLTASVNDLDLLVLRDSLQRMDVFRPDLGIEEYLSETKSLSPFVPPLCFREPLTGSLRPRNFAMLLFARNLQAHIPGAYSLFSIYAGTDRSEPYAERHELAGNLIEQARRLVELLDVQSYTAFDKTDRTSPNAVKYPPRALQEAMINALAHRDYEMVQPSRVTVFSDRIEILSPGSLPTGVSEDEFRKGQSPPKWRNQSLAWFFNRLQPAQAEGQGIPTILRSMREEGCPPPKFDVNEVQVRCLLPAHPRHSLARDHRASEEAISLGEFERARAAVETLPGTDPTNVRTVQLFSEIQLALKAPAPVRAWPGTHLDRLGAFPPIVLTQLADVLTQSEQPAKEDTSLAVRLYLEASRGRIAEKEIRQIAVGLSKSGDHTSVMEFLDTQFQLHPELKDNPSLLQIRGNALIGKAKQCTVTASNKRLPPASRNRAWEGCRRFLGSAWHDLRRAASLATYPPMVEGIQKNPEFVEELKVVATPPSRRLRRNENQAGVAPISSVSRASVISPCEKSAATSPLRTKIICGDSWRMPVMAASFCETGRS